MNQSRYVVQPVLKALKVLDAVASLDGSARLATVAPRLGLPKTTVFRYLCTLVAAEYLEHDPAKDLYRIGARFRVLGLPSDDVERLRQLALPVLVELRDRFDETINLGVLRGSDIVYVDIVESQRRLRMQAHVGGRDPVHSTALGKAILAYLPEAERYALLPNGLSARTRRTQTVRTTLNTELGLTVRRGYAVERGENEDGAACVGAAIRDASGYPRAAISLSAPESRLLSGQVAEVGRALQEAAERIAARLGGGTARRAAE